MTTRVKEESIKTITSQCGVVKPTVATEFKVFINLLPSGQ